MLPVIPETFTIASPAAPASGATAVLFNSETMLGVGVMRLINLTMLEVVYLQLSHDSAANGLKAYAKHKPGTAETWRQVSIPDSSGTATMPMTVTALAADTNHKESFTVSEFAEFKLEHTNSANTLTGWELTITGTCNGAAVQK